MRNGIVAGTLFVALSITTAALAAPQVGVPQDLLQNQAADGEIAGWKSFHESPGARTLEVWKLNPDGVLVCRGTRRGYLFTEKDYADFELTFEWRWPPQGKPGNGGVLIRKTGDDKIWPKSLEIQLNAGRAGDFWAIGGFAASGPADRTKKMDHAQFGKLTHIAIVESVEKPAGEWNQGVITARGGTVTVKMNGKEVNQAIDCEIAAGKILLTAEGNEIHFRNVRLTPLLSRPDKLRITSPY